VKEPISEVGAPFEQEVNLVYFQSDAAHWFFILQKGYIP
jgi:hypothetical protein